MWQAQRGAWRTSLHEQWSHKCRVVELQEAQYGACGHKVAKEAELLSEIIVAIGFSFCFPKMIVS